MYSIVIPTHNRYRQLTRLLSSVCSELSKDSPQVVVVDDGSSDATCYMESLSNENFSIVHIPGQGPSIARNVGAQHVQSDYILFIDDDCILPRGYYEKLHCTLARDGWDILGGATRAWTEQGSKLSIVSQFLRDTGHLAGPYYDAYGQIRCLPSSHLLVTRSAFHALGGFDARFPLAGGEDNNLTQRAIADGLRVKACADLWVYHEHVNSMRALCRKFYEYGIGNAINCTLLNYSTRQSKFRAQSWSWILMGFPGLVWESFREARKLPVFYPDRLYYVLLLVLRQLAYDTGGIIGSKRYLQNRFHARE